MTGPTGPRKKIAHRIDKGSAHPLEIRYLAVGRIVRAHGVHGELSMAILTDFPDRFKSIEQVYLGNEFDATPYILEGYRWHKKNLLLKLSGVTTRTQAESLRNLFVQVPIDEATPLPEGTYYLYQLIGLEVVTTATQILGTLVNVLETGANDVYVIKSGDQEILLPAIDEVIKSIDLENKRVTVELIDGLI